MLHKHTQKRWANWLPWLGKGVVKWGRRNGGVWVTKAAFKKPFTEVSLVILEEKSAAWNSDYGIHSHGGVSAQRQQDLHQRPRGVLHPRVCEFLSFLLLSVLTSSRLPTVVGANEWCSVPILCPVLSWNSSSRGASCVWSVEPLTVSEMMEREVPGWFSTPGWTRVKTVFKGCRSIEKSSSFPLWWYR